VIFALSTGENTLQANGPRVIIYEGRTLLTDQQRSLNTHNAVLFALDAKTGKVLYQSGDAITGWVHFSGLAVANGRFMPWTMIQTFIALVCRSIKSDRDASRSLAEKTRRYSSLIPAGNTLSIGGNAQMR